MYEWDGMESWKHSHAKLQHAVSSRQQTMEDNYHTATTTGKQTEADVLSNDTEVLELLPADVRKIVNGTQSKINQCSR